MTLPCETRPWPAPLEKLIRKLNKKATPLTPIQKKAAKGKPGTYHPADGLEITIK